MRLVPSLQGVRAGAVEGCRDSTGLVEVVVVVLTLRCFYYHARKQSLRVTDSPPGGKLER